MTRQVLDWKVLVKHILQQKSKTQNFDIYSFAKFPFQNLLDHPV